jgi:hypothetical protein
MQIDAHAMPEGHARNTRDIVEGHISGIRDDAATRRIA